MKQFDYIGKPELATSSFNARQRRSGGGSFHGKVQAVPPVHQHFDICFIQNDAVMLQGNHTPLF